MHRNGQGFETAADVKTFQRLFKEIEQHLTQSTPNTQAKTVAHNTRKQLLRLAQKISAECKPLLGKLSKNEGRPLTIDLCRGCAIKFFRTPLGAGDDYSRYGIEGMRTLYFTENENTVIRERKESGLQKSQPHYHIWAEIRLQNVLDLTDPKTLSNLGLRDAQEVLYLEWQALQDVCEVTPFTQSLGSKALDLKYEGILFESARDRESSNLVIFPDNLQRKSSIQVYDPTHQYPSIGICSRDTVMT
ncbi:MAG: RES family NAD+ phosphorylase [Zetaproteobacteria bacterium]|nr:RES family NAD+ phosphorylase [Zetaproteobacteria bacterium]